MKKLFKNLLNKKGLDDTAKFDWMSGKTKIPQAIGVEEQNEDDQDFKQKLKALLNK